MENEQQNKGWSGGKGGTLSLDECLRRECLKNEPPSPLPSADPDPPLNPILDGLLRFVGWR